MLILIHSRPNGGLTTSVAGLVTIKSLSPRFLNEFSGDYLFLPITTIFNFIDVVVEKLEFSPIFLA